MVYRRAPSAKIILKVGEPEEVNEKSLEKQITVVVTKGDGQTDPLFLVRGERP